MYIVLDNQKSHPTEVLSGVPQGTVLAPLLFLLYSNDLPACVHNRIKLYADDILLYSNINSVADCIALQQDLDSLVEWSHSWQMTFNPQKCECLRIANKNPVLHNYYIQNCLINNVPHTRLVSIMLQNLPIMLFGISLIFCLLCLFLCFLDMDYADI